MTSTTLPKHLLLAANPFEPAATGAPLYGSFQPPQALEKETRDLFDRHGAGSGVRAIIVVGEYGTGKSCLLEWLHREYCRRERLRSFYFDNPGVHFYDLANSLLRTLGRKDFAKSLWELVRSHVGERQRTLFDRDFEVYLERISRSRANQPRFTIELQKAVRAAGLADDDEVAHCLARIVTDVVRKPYFEYRDFVPRQAGSIVPENEEAPYFRSILKTIQKAYAANGIMFLIDEFEEIGLQKRLTRRAAHDYLATMKRLVNLSQSDGLDFWIILSMTPDAFKLTKELDPALMQRVSETTIRMPWMSEADARAILRERVMAVRSRPNGGAPAVPELFPFPEGELPFSPQVLRSPRRLIKVCFRAIADSDAGTPVPFESGYLSAVESQVYPDANRDE